MSEKVINFEIILGKIISMVIIFIAEILVLGTMTNVKVLCIIK